MIKLFLFITFAAFCSFGCTPKIHFIQNSKSNRVTCECNQLSFSSGTEENEGIVQKSGFCTKGEPSKKLYFNYEKRYSSKPFKGCFGTILYKEKVKITLYQIQENDKVRKDTSYIIRNEYPLEQ